MSPRRMTLSIGAVLLAACGAVAVRQAVGQQAVGKRFEQLDRNGDAKVTPDELPVAAFFQRLDLDGDGAITKPEAVEAMRTGVLKDLRGRVGRDAPSGKADAREQSTTPTPNEPPVRQGPQPVRPGDHGIGRHVGDVAFTDLAGRSNSLAEVAAGRVAVFVMTSTSCPISRKYLPTLEEFVSASGDRIAWILVNPVATDKPADMQAAAAGFGGRVIYVHDPRGELAAWIGAVTTTDVVVLAADRTIAYHGAIDDQYGFGYAIDAPRRRYLADALAAEGPRGIPPMPPPRAGIPTAGRSARPTPSSSLPSRWP